MWARLVRVEVERTVDQPAMDRFGKKAGKGDSMRSGVAGLNLRDSVTNGCWPSASSSRSQVMTTAPTGCALILLLAAEDPTGHLALHQLAGRSISAGMAIYDTMVLTARDGHHLPWPGGLDGEFLLAAGYARAARPAARPDPDAPAAGGIAGQRRRHRHPGSSSSPGININCSPPAQVPHRQPIERIDGTRPRPLVHRPGNTLTHNGLVDHVITALTSLEPRPIFPAGAHILPTRSSSTPAGVSRSPTRTTSCSRSASSSSACRSTTPPLTTSWPVLLVLESLDPRPRHHHVHPARPAARSPR